MKLNIGILLIALLSVSSCINEFLDFTPEDKVTSAMFPKTEADVKMLLNGVYANLREPEPHTQGLFGFGVLDGATPNAFNWEAAMAINKLGRGALSSSDGHILTFRWTRCYSIISRSNYLLSVIDGVTMDENTKNLFIGEAHFLRGLAYATLVESYGGIPIVPPSMTAEEARKMKRASSEDEIFALLKKEGIDENTLVIFTADNGADSPFGGSNQPLRGWKGSTWEGGFRVPCVIRWPGKVSAGKICNEVVTTMDFFPTIAHYCYGRVPDDVLSTGKMLPRCSREKPMPNRKPKYSIFTRGNNCKLYGGVNGNITCH